MKILSALLFCCVCVPVSRAQNLPVGPRAEIIPASPQSGFNFPYVLETAEEDQGLGYLVVETNNTGTSSDDMSLHVRAAVAATASGVGAFAAASLGLPLLVPAFPRPATNGNIYTHALDRDTMDIESGDLERLDLQLIAMIDDALGRLRQRGVSLDQKIVIVGFSASGTFANRFTFLHPDRVAVTVSGGINGMPMLPVRELDGIELNFPLGLFDYEIIAGTPFDRKQWTQIPQLLFMGEKDTNDTLLFDDAFSEAEKRTIRTALGERMLLDRWRRSLQVYGQYAPAAIVRTYEGIGHGTDQQINTDIAEFIRTALSQRNMRRSSATISRGQQIR